MMAVMRRSDVTARVYLKTGVIPIAVKTVIMAVKNKRVSVFSISIMPIIIRSQLRMQTVYHCHLRSRINADTVCYFFQKNRQRVRGLTYYLNREMALTDTDITYINLGEDMGLPGLREDKRSLHPCEQKKKYFIMVEV